MTKTMEKKLEIWKKKLLDIGMRNRLINYKETKRGNLNITSPDLKSLYKALVIDEKILTFPRVMLLVQDIDSLIEESENETGEVYDWLG